MERSIDDHKQAPVFHTYSKPVSDKFLLPSPKDASSSVKQDSRRMVKKLRYLGIVPDQTLDNSKSTQPYSAFVNQRNTKQEFPIIPRKHNVLAIAVTLLITLLFGTLVYTFWYVFLAVQPVTAYQVDKKQNVSQYIGGGGLAYPHQQLDMSFPVAERVIDVMVKAGDHVKQNQPLIKLDPAQLNAQVTQASNDVAAAQSYLYSISNSSPYNPVTVAQAQQALDIAKNHYNALVAQASSPTLNSGNLISPVNGVVTIVNINPGEVFDANNILLTIMDLSTVTVHAKISLANLQQIKVGSLAQVTPSALPNITLQGKVVSIIPQADPQTDTFEVWVDVPNAQQQLLPGMSAFVRIQGQQVAFVIPRVAVLNPDRESAVFIVRNGHAYMQPVHVAGNAPNFFFIDNGLSISDTIVLLPLNKLHDGQAVHLTSVQH